jgi:hypothetical protein
MRLRHIWGIAVFCGAVGTLGGQTAQAQAPSSVRFVSLLLSKEAKLIKSDTKALNTRDKDILKLNAATRQSQINQLNKALTKLHSQVLSMTTKLQLLALQVVTDAKHLSPANSPANQALVNRALASVIAVQRLSLRACLGLNPATQH